jgi:putative restriction endonuclease
MPESIPDAVLRTAIFDHVRSLPDSEGLITWAQLEQGFAFHGQRIPLLNRPKGIFKPVQLEYLLSIQTVFGRKGRPIRYDDQRSGAHQIFVGDETIEYAFQGEDPTASDNRLLRAAFEAEQPIIYFVSATPNLYRAFLPTFIVGWDPKALKARLAVSLPGETTLQVPETAGERRYALREVKQRLHQDAFRAAVVTAYRGCCALSGLPEPDLLDAAHIVGDKDELMGQPVIPNGLALSKLHHAAFDAHMIGIDPDYRIHVGDRLLGLTDGPQLEALKQLNGREIRRPVRRKDYPDRDRLDRRYALFRAAN